jgi:glucosamine--fructose-6-phosphate aminotransferase (isomerizing)
MCGIVGYMVIESLSYSNKKVKRLEYRGYDSAGVMIYDGDAKNV